MTRESASSSEKESNTEIEELKNTMTLQAQQVADQQTEMETMRRQLDPYR
jgi:hypothetical protein